MTLSQSSAHAPAARPSNAPMPSTSLRESAHCDVIEPTGRHAPRRRPETSEPVRAQPRRALFLPPHHEKAPPSSPATEIARRAFPIMGRWTEEVFFGLMLVGV